MKWSQLKKRIEANFAESVAGRVEVWNTRYRESHDQEGEAWITIDKQRIASMGSYTFLMEQYRKSDQLREEEGCADVEDTEQREGYLDAWDRAKKLLNSQGVLAMWDANSALFDFLSLSIEEAIVSENPLIRAIATLDRRFGKRRLKGFDDSREHPWVKILYRFRCKAEGINETTE